MKNFRHLGLLILILSLPALACGLTETEGPPRNAVIVPVLANSSLEPWLTEAVNAFNETEVETEAGQPAFVTVAIADAGEAVVQLEEGGEFAVWIPDSPVWRNVLDSGAGWGDNCASVAHSPLVIAMWQPLAEALGWPARELGWLDIGSLAADPSSWAYYSGGQFGDSLRLGHTHPGLSGSGVSTLLAIVQAAESQQQAVGVEEIQEPIVQASVGAFEGAVSWFSSSTSSLAATMAERGQGFLGAAVMYESDVVHFGRAEPPLVPIYPFEGTFIASHPACVNEGADAAIRQAAVLFRDYLLGEEAQRLAVSSGLRPANNAIPADALQEFGVELSQPETVFGEPSVETLFAVQELWQAARKDVNLVMLLDVSGSMAGRKMDNMREAAIQFVAQMGDDDYLSVIAFASQPFAVVKYQQVGAAREEIVAAIEGLRAEGDTSLYDAIGDGALLLQDTATAETTNALVVLTDGLDTISYRYDQESAVAALAPTGATVFAIAYGSDADEVLLENIALQANGNYFRGDEASIAAIYEEMSAAFGGAVGVGR
jgi:Ca-activated chloride channel family protein